MVIWFFIGIGTGILLGRMATESMWKKKVIRHGFAYWGNDEDGNSKFFWMQLGGYGSVPPGMTMPGWEHRKPSSTELAVLSKMLGIDAKKSKKETKPINGFAKE